MILGTAAPVGARRGILQPVMRLALLVLLALTAPTAARTEISPPPKVHVVTGKVRSLESMTISKPYQLLIVDITGAATAKPAYAEVVPYDPKTACKVAWAFHSGPELIARPGDVVGPFVILPCLEKEPRNPDEGPPWAQILPRILPVTLGSVALDSYVPTTFERVKEGDTVALKGLRRLIEVFGTSYKARFQGAVAKALVDIRTLEALRYGIEIDASTVYGSILWKFTPGAYEAIEPFVIADITSDKIRRMDMIEALWMLSPKRTRALVARLLPKHATRVPVYTQYVADPAIYDHLIAHYRTTKVASEKAAVLGQLTSKHTAIPFDDYLEPFLESVGGPAVAVPLAQMVERRKHNLGRPPGLLAYVNKYQYKYDQMKLIKGVRLAWRVKLYDRYAVEPGSKIKLEFQEDAETTLPHKAPWVLIEGVVTDASTSVSDYDLSVKLAFVRFTPVP